jgi:ectoine hydroxylase-related dioxygenase (phytanoyl-CoA dioxygenase family)
VTGLPALDEPAALDDATIAAFRRDGHVRVDGLATASEIAAYRPVIEATAERLRWDHRPLAERDTYGRAFVQSANLWRHDEAVARFTLAPRFARAAAVLLGVDALRIYHDQALVKEAGGGATPWHQDQHYWPLDTDATITLWVPLVDVRDPVEGMTFASGSHRLGDLGGGVISDASEVHFDGVVRARAVPLHTERGLAAGDATFHRGWTLHRASDNPTSVARPVMTVIYVADGARVARPTGPAQDFDRMMWLGGAAPGTLVDGPDHPRVGG